MITNATYLTGYRIEVEFDNGLKKTIDLQNLLENSNNKLIRKFLKLSLFRKFKVEDGTLVWGDNEFDLNPMSERLNDRIGSVKDFADPVGGY